MVALKLKIPPVGVAVLFAALMWWLSGITPGITLPASFRTIFLLVFTGAGACIGLAGVSAFRKASTTVNPLTPAASSSLVVTGIFQWSRNPMYLALLLVLIGWGIYLANLFSLLMASGFVAYMNRFQIQPEERALEEKFGTEFTLYRQKVRKWL